MSKLCLMVQKLIVRNQLRVNNNDDAKRIILEKEHIKTLASSSYNRIIVYVY